MYAPFILKTLKLVGGQVMEQENFSVLFDLPAAPEQKKLDIDKKKWDLKWV